MTQNTVVSGKRRAGEARRISMSWMGNQRLSASAQWVWDSLRWMKEKRGMDIRFTREYRDRFCYTQRALPFDFAVKRHGRLYLVEFDGEQHAWYRTSYDRRKEEFCADSNIPLLILREADVGF